MRHTPRYIGLSALLLVIGAVLYFAPGLGRNPLYVPYTISVPTVGITLMLVGAALSVLSLVLHFARPCTSMTARSTRVDGAGWQSTHVSESESDTI